MTKNFKIGSAVALVGLIAFLIFRVYSLRDDKTRLEWELAAKDDAIDTIRVVAEYSVPETVWVPTIRYDTTEGRIDTIYGETPKLSGSIRIDTTKELGADSNPVSIRVVGELWYPKEYSNRNWLLIHPVAGTPYLPPTPRSPRSWGLGVTYTRSFSGDYFGTSVRRGKITLGGAYDPWRKKALGTVMLRIL